jgi:hypothetical protein
LAGFKGHITFGIITAIIFSGSAFLFTQESVEVIQLAFCMTIFSSMLPDIDSNSGIPVQVIFGILSIITMLLVFDYFRVGRSIDLLGAASSLGSGLCVYFMLQNVFKKMTTHRGVFHSIPMGLIFGLTAVTVLSNYPLSKVTLIILGGSVVVGYLCHLTLDELNSMATTSIFALKPKKSFGTALKLTSCSSLATAVMYVMLCYLIFLNKLFLYDVLHTFY